MPFDFENVVSTQFGVCRDAVQKNDCVLVPVDAAVQAMLRDIVAETNKLLSERSESGNLSVYEPSEAYSSSDSAQLALSSPFANVIKILFDNENLPIDAAALKQPSKVSAYFCILHDSQQNKVLAIRRASQFKAILKSRLAAFVDDSLRAIPDNVFRLDSEFDMLVDDESVFILHLAGWDALSNLDQVLSQAAEKNLEKLAESHAGIKCSSLLYYVKTHKRAARLVAALLARGDFGEISTNKLKRECKKNDIEIRTIDGQLVVSAGHEKAFLELCDRRRYTTSLVEKELEQYVAGSRRKTGSRPSDAGAAQSDANAATAN